MGENAEDPTLGTRRRITGKTNGGCEDGSRAKYKLKAMDKDDAAGAMPNNDKDNWEDDAEAEGNGGCGLPDQDARGGP